MTAFDIPSFEYNSLPFEERYDSLLKNIFFDHPFVVSTFWHKIQEKKLN
jgi:hypothetical protein